MPVDGFVLSIDGKLKMRYESAKDATAAGTKLKQSYPVIQVAVYDATARVYTPVELHERRTRPRPPARQRLAKGDDPHRARFAGGLSGIELTLRLEVRPGVHRARGSLDRDAQAVGPCDVCSLLGLLR